jgi:NADP-reducing hydrogenase subunit HndD
MVPIVEKQKDDNPPIMLKVEFHDDNDGSIVTVLVPEGTRLTDAAEKCGVKIPTLCHHPRLTPAGKCGVCVVAVEGGPTPTQLACSTVCRPTEDGSPLKVHVHGAMLNGLANAALRRNLDLSIQKQTQRFVANNGNAFAPCGLLEIEDLAQWMNQASVDVSSNCITYDPSLCIGCSRCVRACDQLQGMKVLEAPLPTANPPAIGIAQAPPCMTTRAGRPLRETDCISCGQCTLFCPTGAIKEVDHTARVMQALLDPEKVVVLQTAPSVRVTLAEMFGGAPGECSEGRLVGAAKACGFQFVFDTNLSADLTIMEEANELLKRIQVAESGNEEEKKKMPLPML